MKKVSYINYHVSVLPYIKGMHHHFLSGFAIISSGMFILLISVHTNSVCTGQRLIKNMRPLFDGAVIEPCLLHGDLWSGNISSDTNGEPVILDPACYCK
jgi:hypothetical protein